MVSIGSTHPSKTPSQKNDKEDENKTKIRQKQDKNKTKIIEMIYKTTEIIYKSRIKY